MRAALNAIYRLSGLAAGFFLVAIAVLSLMQIGARTVGFTAHSFDEFAGYCMAASTFLGLCWALRANEHIRLKLLITRTTGGVRRGFEVASLIAATGIVGFFAWSVIDMTWTSFELNEPSQGLVPIPIWIPQSGMALGLSILFIAFLDDLVVTVSGGTPSYDRVQALDADAPVHER